MNQNENLAELPKGWAWTRLGEACQYLPTGIEEFEGKIEYYSTGSIQDGGYIPEGMYSFSERPSRANRMAKRGDLFQARMAGTNKALLIGKELENKLFSTGFIQLRPFSCCPRMSAYIYYYIQSPDFLRQRDVLATGSTQIALTDDRAQQIIFPLAPLPEQRRIVTKLEELFTKLEAGVSALKKMQAQLKRYRQSVLKTACEGKLVPTEAELARAEGRAFEPADVLLARILKERREKSKGGKYKEPAAPDISGLPVLPEGWCWANVGQITEMIGSGITPLGGNKNYLSEGVLFIRSQNVQMMSLDLSDVAYVSQELHEQMSRTHVYFDDVLLNITGASIGRVAWFNHPNLPANVNQHVCILRLVQKFPKWLTLFLASSFGQNQIMSKQSGATRQGLNYEQAKQLAIPLSPIAEQRRIVAEVERRLSVADGVERTVEQSLAQAQRLRQSILKKAFEGKLVPQDARDEPAEKLLERIKQEKAKRKSSRTK